MKRIGDGINPVVSGNSVVVYPNPTRGELRVESGELRVERVEVLDVFGKKLSTLNSQLSTKMDISHLPAGIYFLRIQTGEGTFVQKVVKN